MLRLLLLASVFLSMSLPFGPVQADPDRAFFGGGATFIEGCGNGVDGELLIEGANIDGAWDLALQAVRTDCHVLWNLQITDAAWAEDPGGCIVVSDTETVCIHGPYYDLFIPPYLAYHIVWTRGDVVLESVPAVWFPSCAAWALGLDSECPYA